MSRAFCTLRPRGFLTKYLEFAQQFCTLPPLQAIYVLHQLHPVTLVVPWWFFLITEKSAANLGISLF